MGVDVAGSRIGPPPLQRAEDRHEDGQRSVSKPYHQQNRYGVEREDRHFVTGDIVDKPDYGREYEGLDEKRDLRLFPEKVGYPLHVAYSGDGLFQQRTISAHIIRTSDFGSIGGCRFHLPDNAFNLSHAWDCDQGPML